MGLTLSLFKNTKDGERKCEGETEGKKEDASTVSHRVN